MNTEEMRSVILDMVTHTQNQEKIRNIYYFVVFLLTEREGVYE